LVSLKYTLVLKSQLPQIILFLNDSIKSLSSEMPKIEIKKGVLVEPQTSYVKEWKDKDEVFAFVIEPDPDKAAITLNKYKNCTVLTQSQLTTKSTKKRASVSEMTKYNLEKISSFILAPVPPGFSVAVDNKPSFDVNALFVERLVKKLFLFAWPLYFLSFFVYFCFVKACQIAFFSLSALWINVFLKAELSYKELLSIGIYALVPPVAMSLVLELAGITIAYQGIVFIALYLFYVYQGIKASKTIAEVEM
ncbi:MAG: DUF1189 family protein, partial [Candidatus Omnitrophica bacterium]|nr:DUF1189 family protein [Candidatus Omnitrophota bacterium]